MRRRERGQTLVEFAIVLPLFMVLLMGVLDFGRVVWSTNTLQAAAREAARYAIVHGGSATTACPVGPPDTGTTVIPASSSSCPYPAPSTQSIKDTATGYATAAGGPVTVTVCYGAGCSGNTNATGATDKRGTPVTVVVSTTVNLVTPALLGITSTPLSATTTMLVNH